MIVVFMILLVGCGLAWADTIDTIHITDLDATRGEYSLWIDQHDAPTSVYYAGVIDISINGIFQRNTLCAQLFVEIGMGTYFTTIMNPVAAQQEFGRNLEQAAWLVDRELPLVTKPDEGAALQLAIWDIVEDGGDGLEAGNVKASTDPNHLTDPTVLGLAETYEEEVLGPDLKGPFQTSDLAFIYVNTDSNGNGAQMLIGPEFGDGPVPNPEPSTLALGGLGLVAASLLLRKKFGHRSR